MENTPPTEAKSRLVQQAKESVTNISKKGSEAVAVDLFKQALTAILFALFGGTSLYSYFHPAPPLKPEMRITEEHLTREADCLAQKQRDVASLTQQRSASWTEYRKCMDEPRMLWQSAEEYCKPKKERHAGIRDRAIEAQNRTCIAAK